jgi:hypothetical protein
LSERKRKKRSFRPGDRPSFRSNFSCSFSYFSLHHLLFSLPKATARRATPLVGWIASEAGRIEQDTMGGDSAKPAHRALCSFQSWGLLSLVLVVVVLSFCDFEAFSGGVVGKVRPRCTHAQEAN